MDKRLKQFMKKTPADECWGSRRHSTARDVMTSDFGGRYKARGRFFNTPNYRPIKHALFRVKLLDIFI